MAIRDTLDTDPLYISDEPDWSQGINVQINYDTSIYKSDDGTEQRTAKRNVAKYRQTFVLSALSIEQMSIRSSRALFEVRSPLIVPIWPMETALVSKTTSVLTLANDATKRKFRKKYHVYIKEDGVGSGFWEVTAVSGVTVTVDISETALLAFTSDAKVWPCMFAIRKGPAAEFTQSFASSEDEKIELEDL